MRLDVITNEDCLSGMNRIPDGSVDMILCDLPYGTTANNWDTVIPLAPLWTEYRRVIKPRGAIVLTSQQPFASALIASNPKWFRCEWIWEKHSAVGFLNANRAPLRAHENVLVFASAGPSYNPQKTAGKPYVAVNSRTTNYGHFYSVPTINDGSRFPRTVLKLKGETGLHPTQKPVALFEYFIRTYSNPGETILDSCMGSGTTAIAALNSGRHFIGFETDAQYFENAQTRVQQHKENVLAKAA